MDNRTFSKQCEALLAAERKREALQSCVDNLPADEKYDLGLRVEWSWGAVMPGYKEMQHAVHGRFNKALRLAMGAALQDAKDAETLARQAVVNYAKGFGQ